MFKFFDDGKGKWQSWECCARIPYDCADEFLATTYGATKAEAATQMVELIEKAVAAMVRAADDLRSNAALNGGTITQKEGGKGWPSV